MAALPFPVIPLPWERKNLYSLGELQQVSPNMAEDLETMANNINQAQELLPLGLSHKQVELEFAGDPPEYLGAPRTLLQLQQTLILPIGETPSPCYSPPDGRNAALDCSFLRRDIGYIEYRDTLGGWGVGRVVRLLCHQILAAWRRVQVGLPPLWQQEGDDRVECYHRCHCGKEGCTTSSHIILRTPRVNKKASSHHCCAYYECYLCSHKMIYCMHSPRCTRVEYTRCYPACPVPPPALLMGFLGRMTVQLSKISPIEVGSLVWVSSKTSALEEPAIVEKVDVGYYDPAAPKEWKVDGFKVKLLRTKRLGIFPPECVLPYDQHCIQRFLHQL
jgi:hypothetical protein